MCGKQPPRHVESPFQLEQLLRMAKKAHTAHEAENGPDPDWELWYALYIWNRLEQH